LKEVADKTRIFWTLLKVQDLSNFEYNLRRRLKVEYLDLPDNYFIEIVLRGIFIA
jgi:hypothetical protein